MNRMTLQVKDEVGLHARPAAIFVKQAGQFDCEIQVRNLTTESDWVDAKSILSVLTLGIEQNHEIELEAEGPDEQTAITALSALVLSDFGDKPVEA